MRRSLQMLLFFWEEGKVLDIPSTRNCFLDSAWDFGREKRSLGASFGNFRSTCQTQRP